MIEYIKKEDVLDLIVPRMNSSKVGSLGSQRLYSILEEIRKMPTLNLDNVIEQLEEHKERIENRKERDILNVVGKTNAKAAIEEDIKILKSAINGESEKELKQNEPQKVS